MTEFNVSLQSPSGLSPYLLHLFPINSMNHPPICEYCKIIFHLIIDTQLLPSNHRHPFQLISLIKTAYKQSTCTKHHSCSNMFSLHYLIQKTKQKSKFWKNNPKCSAQLTALPKCVKHPVHVNKIRRLNHPVQLKWLDYVAAANRVRCEYQWYAYRQRRWQRSIVYRLHCNQLLILHLPKRWPHLVAILVLPTHTNTNARTQTKKTKKEKKSKLIKTRLKSNAFGEIQTESDNNHTLLQLKEQTLQISNKKNHLGKVRTPRIILKHLNKVTTIKNGCCRKYSVKQAHICCYNSFCFLCHSKWETAQITSYIHRRGSNNNNNTDSDSATHGNANTHRSECVY